MSVIQSTFPIDYDSATISSTAVTMETIGFTAAQLLQASQAFISIETNPVRVRYDGTAPTASEGHLLAVGDKITITGNKQIRNLQFIAQTTDGTVRITIEGRNAY